jgi:spermidine synthase
MPEKIALNYAKMMLFGMQFSKNPKKILVIGMGIGTIPQEINKFFPKAEIDIVEISSKIPPIAEEFFDFKKTDKIKIFIQDGYDFILNSKPNIYDVIFSDAFDGTYIPAKMLTNKYLLGIKNVLKEDGILIMNTFEKSESYQKEEKLVTDNFESVFEIVNNNRILFASKNPLIKGLIPDGLKNKIDFKENSLKLKKLK